MDWALAIRRNRAALLRVLAGLFALVGLEERQLAVGNRQSGQAQAADGPAVRDCCPHPEMRAEGEPRRTLPRHLNAHALRILRAAEAAIRRLIVVAARGVTVGLRPGGEALPRDFGGKRTNGANSPAAMRIPAFPLFDPLRRFSFDPPRRGPQSLPRISVVGITEPAPIPEKPVLFPDDPVSAASLRRRLLSSRRALANLPREARRLARWKARLRLRPGPGRVLPLRFGRPPGGRKRPIHAVDDILKECHAVAIDALSLPDTS